MKRFLMDKKLWKDDEFENKVELKEIYDLWKKSYSTVLGRVCLLSDLDRKLLKKLFIIYGFQDLKLMIYYYWKNYKQLPFHKKVEIPKIGLLYYYRDDFHEQIKNLK